MNGHPTEDAEDVVWKNFRKRAKDLRTRSELICEVSPAEKKRIFRARALALSQEKEQTLGDQELLHVISFYIAGEFFGIEVKYLQEVYETTQVTKIPCTPDVLVGLINYRGAVLTIIDLSILLDLRRHRKNNETPAEAVLDAKKILIVEHAGAKAGLIIQKLDHLLELPRDRVQPVSSFFRDKNQIVKWETQYDDMPLLVIDPEAMLTDERLNINEDI